MKRVKIGRAFDNDLVFDSLLISNYHAEVVENNGKVVYTDHSTNGTMINGVVVHNDSLVIKENDIILLPSNVRIDWNMLFGYSNNKTVHIQKQIKEDESKGGDYRSAPETMYGPPYPSDSDDCFTVTSMSLTDAVSHVFAHYADFSGRARRKEFWWFALVNVVLSCIPYVGIVWALATIVPQLALSARRLHDIGRSGFYMFFACIPIVGIILLTIWWCQDSEHGNNEYGPSPKYNY